MKVWLVEKERKKGSWIEWILELERLITSHQKSWQVTTVSSVIAGPLVAFSTFSFADTRLSMVMTTRKFCKWWPKVNLTLMEKNGMISRKMPRTWLKNWYVSLKRDWQHRRPWITNGSKKLSSQMPKNQKKLWARNLSSSKSFQRRIKCSRLLWPH